MKTQPLPKEVTISPDVLFQELGSETVLLDLDNELYYALDEVGTRLWQPLAENGDPAAAMARLSAEYDVDEATLTHRRGNRRKPGKPVCFLTTSIRHPNWMPEPIGKLRAGTTTVGPDFCDGMKE